MVKLVINIPCLNEEKTLPLILSEIPKKIEGIDKIEVQIVDDGSKDGTVEVARRFNVDRIIKHKKNKGLGEAFKSGVDAALKNGVDIFVNTDADNQYPSRYIEKLVKPVLEGKADIVIGDRQTSKIKHFSPSKKFFQRLGSWTVRKLSNTKVRDAVSGFRAYSKEALLKLNITSKFSYCIDTIIQAGKKNLKVVDVKIRTNPPTRRSRLFSNIFQHIKRSTANLVRVYVMYEPFKTFFYLCLVPLLPGLFLLFRFLFFYFNNQGSGHIQSLVISAILIIAAMIIFAMGIMADLNSLNRKLIEENLYLTKKEKYK
jgi:glycosyltransferase involved in cell wall biosynthesis